MRVSVAVIVRDAESTLANCLESVSGITDDIVVIIDSRTTDKSSQIARAYKAKTISNDFVDFSTQRNFAAEKAKYDWIFALDSDETASPGLIAAIKQLPDDPIYKAYLIPRQNKIFQKYIRHTNWDPYGLIRLYDRKKTSWSGKIHEQVIPPEMLGRIYDPILHDNYKTVMDFLNRQDYYSTISSNQLYSQKVPFSIGRFIGDPVSDFLRRFIIHAGFLDSWHGLFLSYLMVIYHLSVWIKLWQKYQKP